MADFGDVAPCSPHARYRQLLSLLIVSLLRRCLDSFSLFVPGSFSAEECLLPKLALAVALASVLDGKNKEPAETATRLRRHYRRRLRRRRPDLQAQLVLGGHRSLQLHLRI